MISRGSAGPPERGVRRGVGQIALASAVALTAAAALSTAAFAGDGTHQNSIRPAAAGASVPFVEQEAESADTNGSVVGPDRTYTKLPSEASGREAVTLSSPGQYVEFTLTQPANAMTVRYSLPDSADGTGVTAPIDVDVNGSKVSDLSLTSKYSWFYGGYPFSNDPGAGNPHHFFDDARMMFDSTLPIGTTVRLAVPSSGAASSYTIDLADFEQVGDPIAAPSGALDVTDYGADPTGQTDSTAAIQQAVDDGEAQGKPVYIPQGTFLVTDHIVVDNVTLAGAGPWYSVLTGVNPNDSTKGVGVYGKDAGAGGSSNVTLKDFAIIGGIAERNDSAQVNAIGGAMSDSTVDDVWMQHTKCGAWMDGPMDNLTIENSRIMDTTADGVNFHKGVTNSTVTNTYVRNTGDDGLAEWSDTVADASDSFTNDTVAVPVLANNIALYGGTDMTVTGNLLSDTVTNGGGIHVGNRYDGVNAGNGTTVAGTFTLSDNTLLRTGNSDYNWNFGVGAIWFDVLNGAISGATIKVTGNEIDSSSYEAFQFIEGTITGVQFSDDTVNGTGTFVLQIQTGGSATFDHVVATNVGYSNPIYSCEGAGSFQIAQGDGNSGWYTDTPYCGAWPAPVY